MRIGYKRRPDGQISRNLDRVMVDKSVDRDMRNGEREKWKEMRDER